MTENESEFAARLFAGRPNPFGKLISREQVGQTAEAEQPTEPEGNYVAREGHAPAHPTADDERQFAREFFGKP